MEKILVLGCTGWGNVGDEMILEGVLEDAKELGEVTVASKNKKVSKKIHKGVDFTEYPLSNMSLKNIIGFVRQCFKNDVLIMGGGYMLHDQTWYNLPILSSITLFMKLLGKKTIVYGVGGGPINRKSSKLFLKIIEKVAKVTVRDGFSKKELSKGISNVIKTADPAFRLYKRLGKAKPDKDIMGVSVCAWLKNSNYWKYGKKAPEHEMEKFIQWLEEAIIKSKVKKVVFLPMYEPYDRRASKKIQKSIKKSFPKIKTEIRDVFYSKEKLEDSFRDVGLLIGMRLHSIIISAMMGVPFLAIVYDDKVRSFCKEIRYNFFAGINDVLLEGRGIEKIQRLKKQRGKISENLLRSSEKMYKRSKKTPKILKKIIRN